MSSIVEHGFEQAINERDFFEYGFDECHRQRTNEDAEKLSSHPRNWPSYEQLRGDLTRDQDAARQQAEQDEEDRAAIFGGDYEVP